MKNEGHSLERHWRPRDSADAAPRGAWRHPVRLEDAGCPTRNNSCGSDGAGDQETFLATQARPGHRATHIGKPLSPQCESEIIARVVAGRDPAPGSGIRG